MITVKRMIFCLLAACVIGNCAFQNAAADDDAPNQPAENSNESADAEFSVFVDTREIDPAWSALNASGLTDMTLQLAGAEFVLNRTHSDVSASNVAQLALKAAIATGHQESIKRLSQYAERTKDTALLGQIRGANKLGGASRGAGDSFMVPVDEVNHDQFTVLRTYRDRIRSAALLGNHDTLAQLLSDVKTLDLPDALKKELIAAGENPASGKSEHNMLLRKIAGGTRGPKALGRVISGANVGNSWRLKGQFVHQPNFQIPGWPAFPGVRITALDFNSPLHALGLNVGDVISRLDGMRIHNLAELDRHWGSSVVKFVRSGNQFVEQGSVNLGPQFVGGGGGGGGVGVGGIAP